MMGLLGTKMGQSSVENPMKRTLPGFFNDTAGRKPTF